MEVLQPWCDDQNIGQYKKNLKRKDSHKTISLFFVKILLIIRVTFKKKKTKIRYIMLTRYYFCG